MQANLSAHADTQHLVAALQCMLCAGDLQPYVASDAVSPALHLRMLKA
jgi:hypothetical protein